MCYVSTKTLSYVTEKTCTSPQFIRHVRKERRDRRGQSKKRRSVAEMPVILWTGAPVLLRTYSVQVLL